MNWKYIGNSISVFMILMPAFALADDHKRLDLHSNNPAVKDFRIQCPGESRKCENTEVTVTNISHKSYSDLIIICKDKDNPDAPDTEPYYTFPFSLESGEVKCMDAVSHCVRIKNRNKKPEEPNFKYVTLLQINSDHDAIWMKPKDCTKVNSK